MLHKLKFHNEISRVTSQNAEDSSCVIQIAIEGCAAQPNLQPESDRIRVDISLSSTQRGPLSTAERRSSNWLCCTRGKLILFTFNLLFPPL